MLRNLRLPKRCMSFTWSESILFSFAATTCCLLVIILLSAVLWKTHSKSVACRIQKSCVACYSSPLTVTSAICTLKTSPFIDIAVTRCILLEWRLTQFLLATFPFLLCLAGAEHQPFLAFYSFHMVSVVVFQKIKLSDRQLFSKCCAFVIVLYS